MTESALLRIFPEFEQKLPRDIISYISDYNVNEITLLSLYHSQCRYDPIDLSYVHVIFKLDEHAFYHTHYHEHDEFNEYDIYKGSTPEHDNVPVQYHVCEISDQCDPHKIEIYKYPDGKYDEYCERNYYFALDTLREVYSIDTACFKCGFAIKQVFGTSKILMNEENIEKIFHIQHSILYVHYVMEYCEYFEMRGIEFQRMMF